MKSKTAANNTLMNKKRLGSNEPWEKFLTKIEFPFKQAYKKLNIRLPQELRHIEKELEEIEQLCHPSFNSKIESGLSILENLNYSLLNSSLQSSDPKVCFDLYLQKLNSAFKKTLSSLEKYQTLCLKNPLLIPKIISRLQLKFYQYYLYFFPNDLLRFFHDKFYNTKTQEKNYSSRLEVMEAYCQTHVVHPEAQVQLDNLKCELESVQKVNAKLERVFLKNEPKKKKKKKSKSKSRRKNNKNSALTNSSEVVAYVAPPKIKEEKKSPLSKDTVKNKNPWYTVKKRAKNRKTNTRSIQKSKKYNVIPPAPSTGQEEQKAPPRSEVRLIKQAKAKSESLKISAPGLFGLYDEFRNKQAFSWPKNSVGDCKENQSEPRPLRISL